MQLVLPFDRDKHEWQRAMKIKMAWPEAPPAARLHRRAVGEEPGVKTVDFQRPRIFRAPRCSIVAARDQDCTAIARRDHDLMRKDAGIELARLAHLLAKAAVLSDTVDGDVARSIVSDEQVLTVLIHAGMDRPRHKREH